MVLAFSRILVDKVIFWKIVSSKSECVAKACLSSTALSLGLLHHRADSQIINFESRKDIGRQVVDVTMAGNIKNLNISPDKLTFCTYS